MGVRGHVSRRAEGAWCPAGLSGEGRRPEACALTSRRSQELHLRPEPHTYLPELGKSEMEFMDSKRPRLELLPDPLLRPSPMLATSQPGGSEDPSKVRPGPRRELLRILALAVTGLPAGARGGLPGEGQHGPRLRRSQAVRGELGTRAALGASSRLERDSSHPSGSRLQAPPHPPPPPPEGSFGSLLLKRAGCAEMRRPG